MIAVQTHKRRRGAATVEFAVVLPLLCLFLLGIWEMGRYVEATHVLTMAAREGARFASIGQFTTAANGTVQITQGTLPGAANGTVANIVEQYLTRMGYSTTGLDVTFTNETNACATEPWQAVKSDKLHVRVRLPFTSIRWSTTSFVVPSTWLVNSGEYGNQGCWASMEDQVFTLNADLASGYPYTYPYRTN